MRTKIVGICNVTPDSFSDGGRYYSPEMAIERIIELLETGADIVDVGAESTRPGAEELNDRDEWSRLETVLGVLGDLGLLSSISLDTRHPSTARQFAAMGGLMLNDVTGFQDRQMVEVALEHPDMFCVVSHLPAQSSSEAHALANKISDRSSVIGWLKNKTSELEAVGLRSDRIVADPGLGFGKTSALNRDLIGAAAHLSYPVMIGYSRKRFLGESRMTIATNLGAAKIALASGAAYLRVHDVAEHARLVTESETI